MARRCSFCGEDRRGVDRLVAGHGSVAICGDCARLAVELTSVSDDAATGDLLLTGIETLVTNDPRQEGLLGVISGAAVAVRNGYVTWVGRERTLPARYRELREIGCEGRMVVPGFVDAHRHLPATSGAGFAEYVEAVSVQLGRLLEQGATTVEMRTWGGPDPETEVTMASAIGAAADTLPCDVSVAVSVGMEPPMRGAGYRSMVESLVLPTVSTVAGYLDVVPGGVLADEDSIRLVAAARRLGMRPRVHVDGVDSLTLALDLRAASGDGMWRLDGAAASVADAGLLAVTIPGASWMSGRSDPGRELWDADVAVALGTGCVGGVVTTMPMAMTFAVYHAGLTPEQALWSATRGGALALEDPEKGVVATGSVADLVVLDVGSAEDLVAEAGRDPVHRVIKDGNPL